MEQVREQKAACVGLGQGRKRDREMARDEAARGQAKEQKGSDISGLNRRKLRGTREEEDSGMTPALLPSLPPFT